MKVWIGIDPGAKGALCALYEDGTLEYQDYDENTYNLTHWLMTIDNAHDIKMCMIENVHSIFGSTAKSNFNFGFNTGILHGLVRGLGLPLDMVQPKAWQKHIGVTKKGKDIKKDVANICERLFPLCEIRGPRGGLLDGRSDATCVAMYCKFKH